MDQQDELHMKKAFSLLLILGLLTACARVATQRDTPSPSEPTVGASPSPPAATATVDEFGPYRNAWQRLIDELKLQGIKNDDVLHAMETVPRIQFVPIDYLDQAYDNHALPIGYGQTISQPYIVAWMTELLELQPGEKVLEIGTGSGYQAAILAELGYAEVYTIEIVPELAESAVERLEKLGYTNIHTKQGDGYYGWPEEAPFDAIIVTAAPDHLPAPLVEQLKPNGRLVIPIGPPGWYQTLWKFVFKDSELVGYNLGGVGFVPFTGPGVEQHATEQSATP
jgi:protein-L-isoaspartate(D-aspartate) O-methyltransferase